MSKPASIQSNSSGTAQAGLVADSRWQRMRSACWQLASRSLRWTLKFCLLAGTVYLVLHFGGLWQQKVLLKSQGENLEQLANEQVPAAMRDMAQQGTAALPEIVRAMGSHRSSVAMAAQQVILDELDRIDNLPEKQAAKARVVLAQTLADEVTEFGPTTTRLAAYLAERLLRKDLSQIPSTDRASLIDSCGQVMRHAKLQIDVSQLTGGQEGNWHETPQPLPWEQTLKLIEKERKAAELAEAARLERNLASNQPTGNITPDGIKVPSLPESAGGAYSAANGAGKANAPANSTAQTETPHMLPDPAGERLPSPSWEPDNFQKPLRLRRLPHKRSLQTTDSSNEINPPLSRENGNQNGSLSPLETEARQRLPSRSQRGGASPDGQPRDETVIRLLQDLVAADQQAANRAATALGERGIPAEYLELAKRLADPDPKIRQSLVEILPRTAGLNARPWLMWLARDENADVRLAAMNMLCTGQDTQLRAEIESLARGDRDERIVELAERLAKQRSRLK